MFASYIFYLLVHLSLSCCRFLCSVNICERFFFLKMPLNTQNAYKVCQKCIFLLQFLWRLLSNEQHIPSEWSLMCSCPSRLPAPYSGPSKQLPPPVLRYLGVFLGGDKGY